MASFRENYHSAIVVDPLLKEIQAFRLKGKRCTYVDFAIYWHDLESPYSTVKIKKVRVVKKDPSQGGVTPR